MTVSIERAPSSHSLEWRGILSARDGVLPDGGRWDGLLRDGRSVPSPGRRGGQPVEATADTPGEGPHPDAVICCRACGHVITRRIWAVSIRGVHEHTVFNPAGLVFRIGCFLDAPGIQPFGPRSMAFTWFAGYAWTVGLCARCGRHLGWLFLAEPFLAEPGPAPDGERLAGFHGLILDRLIERSEENGTG